jgi:PhoH-like ATPase
VLDTNVLMHDPSSLFRFEEHDVYLPMMTLEELDNHKKGMSKSRATREVSRTLDALVADGGPISAGIPLSRLGSREALGRLYFQTRLADIAPVEGLPAGKADNQILGVVRALQRDRPDRQVVLVSKDINMRIKAHALGLPAEDYFNDQVLEDKDLLYNGVRELPQDFWTKHAKGMESWQDTKTGTTYYRVTGRSSRRCSSTSSSISSRRTASRRSTRSCASSTARRRCCRRCATTATQEQRVGITARNREQNFALNLLMNPEIDFVTLLGQAGTGKTLLALAAGLAQVLDDKRYNEIIVTRATVPVGEDIGFLPGTEEEKMRRGWAHSTTTSKCCRRPTTGRRMGPCGHAGADPFAHQGQEHELHARAHLRRQVPDHRRGAEPDAEADEDARHARRPRHEDRVPGQHRADRHALPDRRQSGLTYVVDRFKGWGHSGHVTLARGERSRLADHARTCCNAIRPTFCGSTCCGAPVRSAVFISGSKHSRACVAKRDLRAKLQ